MELYGPISLEDKERIALRLFKHNIELEFSGIRVINTNHVSNHVISLIKRNTKRSIHRGILNEYYSRSFFAFCMKAEFDYHFTNNAVKSATSKIVAAHGTEFLFNLLFEEFL